MKSKQQFKSRFCIQDYDYDDLDSDAFQESDLKYEDFPKLEFEEAYEINYKPKGFLIDEVSREIYIDLDCEFQLVAEDEMKLFDSWYVILDRSFDFDEKIIIYRLLQFDSKHHQEIQTKKEDRFLKRIEKSFTNVLQSIFKNVGNGKD
jgi:hypothetical protein